MHLLKSATGAADVANALADALSRTVHPTARQLYRTLAWIAVETTRRRGHSPNTTEAVLHLPLEQLARACGVSRVTVWRHLPALRELGVVDCRTHKGALRGETRNTGTVWRVRMTPVRGSKARLSYDDLKHRWRDLDRDCRAGRTSYAALKHTRPLKLGLLGIESLLVWTLPPVYSKNPVTPVCFTPQRADLETVLDVTGPAREERAAAVSLAAEALATALRDHAGLNWYRRLLWQLLRRYDATGDDYSYQLYLTAVRARVDAAEGFARRPGALFTSRLKAAPWFDEVMRGPPVRVGVKPLTA